MIASTTIIKNKNCFENYSDYNFKSHKHREIKYAEKSHSSENCQKQKYWSK